MIAEAVEYAKRRGRIEPADPRWIIALAWHGAALCATGQKAEGLTLAEEAVGAARKFHGADSNVLEETQGALGWIFGGCMRDAKRALEPMREAYAISVKREAPESENRAFRQTMLTETLFQLSMHDEVERLLRETPPVPFSSAALQTAPAVFRLNWEADTRLRLGDTEKAEEIAEEAVRLMEGQKLFVVAERQYWVLASALHQNGKLERAEKFALAALEHEDVDRPATPERRAAKLLLLSWIRIDLGKHQGALEAADQALKLYSEKGALSPSARARVDFRRGRALLGLGRHHEAVEALASSNAYWVEWRKSNPTSVPAATIAYWYGQALVAAGEAARGRALIAEAKPTLATSRYARDRALVKDHPRTGKSP
jgi:tetratricopeptide (TPR) repeat protein